MPFGQVRLPGKASYSTLPRFTQTLGGTATGKGPGFIRVRIPYDVAGRAAKDILSTVPNQTLQKSLPHLDALVESITKGGTTPERAKGKGPFIPGFPIEQQIPTRSVGYGSSEGRTTGGKQIGASKPTPGKNKVKVNLTMKKAVAKGNGLPQIY